MGNRLSRILLTGGASIVVISSLEMRAAAQSGETTTEPERSSPLADGERPNTLPTVIVTATKRETTEQSTPIALTAFSEDELRNAGASNIEDLTGLAPGLTATNINGQFVATIRGVGNELLSSGVAEAGVAFHTNGVYTGSLATSSLSFFDVQRIEVLRGPQGTLWGRNSTGGAINVIQNRPSRSFEAQAELDYSSFNTFKAEGSVSGPVSDGVQFRLASRYSASDGYIEDLSGRGDLGDDNSFSARASANIDLGSRGSWLVAGGFADQDFRGYPTKQNGTGFAAGQINPVTALLGVPLDGSISFAEIDYGAAAPVGEYSTYATNPETRYDLEAYYLTSEISYEVAGVNLTFLTDYRQHERAQLIDGDFTPQSLVEDSTLSDESADEFSQEIRISNTQPGSLEWLLGVYYFRQKVDNDVLIDFGPYPSVPDTLFGPLSGGLIALPNFPNVILRSGGELDVESYAAFGQARIELSEAVSANLGLRYSRDEKSADEFSFLSFDAGFGVVPIIACPGVQCPIPTSVEDSWDEFTGRVGLDFAPDENLLVFANVSKGYKAGGINLGSLTGVFDPESVWTGEIGMKSTFWSNRAQANITGFVSDFTGYQLQVVDTASTVITNADAEIYGIEAEFTILPTNTSRLGLVATWNSSEITSYGPSGSTTNPATLATVEPGLPLPRTPEFAFRIDAENDFRINEASRITLAAAYRWQSETNLDAFGTFNATEDSYGLLDAYVRYSRDDSDWSIDLYGRNLTDEFYKTSAFLYSTVLGSTVQANIGAPRTIGVRARKIF